MPDIIHLLPDTVANQIAAGEVIQRPASVVKELVENAIDANSSVISIMIKDGGKTIIQVSDDGFGMSETDARMSFERHATSKLREALDVFSLHTLGFRGEALASIASVSQLTLKTRQPDNELGTEIAISGSAVESQKSVVCQTGTIIIVRNLFFNIPARRKFLKSVNTELKHIIYEVQRMALANPHIEFNLEHNHSEIYSLPPTKLKQRIIHIFGKGINQNLTEIQTDTSIVKIRGFIGKPEFARKTPGEQFFFVNNRFMKHPYFHRAMMTAYEKILPPETMPSYFIFFEASPESIDVNIHPTKTEIKFENEAAVFQILVAATREALGKFNIVPSIDFNTEGAIEFPVKKNDMPLKHPIISYNPDYNPFDHERMPGRNTAGRNNDIAANWEKLYVPTGMEPPVESSANAEQTDQSALNFPDNNPDSFIQLRNRYILTPVKSGLMMIDQKRAHERILYEQYIQCFTIHFQIAQQTLFPETIELDHTDYLIIKEMLDDLQKIGFDIRDFGNNTIVIAGYPSDSRFENAGELIEGFLAQYKNTGMDITIPQKEKIACSLAVSGAINYGYPLSQEKMQELVDRLFACESPAFSPMGKQVVVILPMEEVERKFKSVRQ